MLYVVNLPPKHECVKSSRSFVAIENDVAYLIQIDKVATFFIDKHQDDTVIYINNIRLRTNVDKREKHIFELAIKICKLESRLCIFDYAVNDYGYRVQDSIAIADKESGSLDDFWRVVDILRNDANYSH